MTSSTNISEKQTARNFFTEEDKQLIKNAILNAELDTSGEIRVHIENTCKGDAMDRAAFIFEKLHMHKTQLRNGVLIYLAIKNRKFAIIGDIGINQKVPDGFWDKIKQTMLNHFRNGEFADGLAEAIKMTGEKLKEHFPYQKDDIDELSNDISYG